MMYQARYAASEVTQNGIYYVTQNGSVSFERTSLNVRRMIEQYQEAFDHAYSPYIQPVYTTVPTYVPVY